MKPAVINLSAKDAAEYIKNIEMPTKSFSEALIKIYPYDDLRDKLFTGFKRCETDISDESVSKNIRNWISGRFTPKNREDIFKIAFILGLSEAHADMLLGIATDYGIHYRNCRDVIYAWFLRNGYEYNAAKEFFITLPDVPGSDALTGKNDPNLTHIVQNAFLNVRNESGLKNTYIENLENFGLLHLKAYTYFENFLDKLVCPSSALNTGEERYSLETVTYNYLRHSMPSTTRLAGFTEVQKLIKHSWPNTTLIKNIKNYKEDVSRKLLLLLYIATENIDDDWDGYDTKILRLEDHIISINAMLNDCGMPPLNAKNPFDWIIMYSVMADEESMSERLSEVIGYIFSRA